MKTQETDHWLAMNFDQAVTDTLDEAIKIIYKHGWTWGDFARNKYGNSCEVMDEGATAFCMLGAIHKALGVNAEAIVYDADCQDWGENTMEYAIYDGCYNRISDTIENKRDRGEYDNDLLRTKNPAKFNDDFANVDMVVELMKEARDAA